jgi:hypothetical protein
MLGKATYVFCLDILYVLEARRPLSLSSSSLMQGWRQGGCGSEERRRRGVAENDEKKDENDHDIIRKNLSAGLKMGDVTRS